MPDSLLKAKLCLQKAKTWTYEQEWRLTLSHEWPNDIVSAHAHIQKEISGVYLGSRMDVDKRERLIEVARAKRVPVYEMYIDPHSKMYEMSYRPIERKKMDTERTIVLDGEISISITELGESERQTFWHFVELSRHLQEIR